MNVTLACAWKPRGELMRFRQIHPQLIQLYSGIVVTVSPDNASHVTDALRDLSGVSIVAPPDWSWGRHAAIQRASEMAGEYIHYVDFERMVRWLETAPHEIPPILEHIRQTDCLIIGRSSQALATHAQALQQTEAIVNVIFSHFLGQSVDLCGGSRGFSRRAVQFLTRHSSLDNAIGADTEWPILLYRAGFSVKYVTADGLAWEIPDHYKPRAVDRATQQCFAEAYDRDAGRWALRVQNALQMVRAGLGAVKRPLSSSLQNAAYNALGDEG